MTTTTEPAPPTDVAAAVQDDEDRAIAHAEATWRTLSEAIDRAGEAGRVPFLVRLTMLTALDHLTPERFAALVAEAERTA
ncbi:hypothetical protein WJ438_09800 [Streptomyces sp. GD-15H]|uniref:hypothetical protein n=1 Tax=Streptomyces sp. GD-15H TaxID=3129112 RepID=UPI0032495573